MNLTDVEFLDSAFKYYYKDRYIYIYILYDIRVQLFSLDIFIFSWKYSPFFINISINSLCDAIYEIGLCFSQYLVLMVFY